MVRERMTLGLGQKDFDTAEPRNKGRLTQQVSANVSLESDIGTLKT